MFGIDVRLPNMKYAAILSSPVFGGKLETYDAREALAMQGVRKIVAIKGEFVPGMDDGIAVIADSWWQANKAIKTLSVKWAGGNSMVDNEMILEHLRKGLGEAPDAVLREIGDVDTAIESAAQVLEAEYFVPYLEHATMEPINCTALVTEDRFEVWAPTQVPEWAFKRAARVANMPVRKGTFHVTQMGGGFGRRQECDYISQAIQIAQAMKGTPVKLIWTREETTQHGFYRPANLSKMRGSSRPGRKNFGLVPSYQRSLR